MATYNAYQQVFGLSLASGAVGDLKGSQSSLQHQLQKRIPELIAPLGAWEVVWGPVVYQEAWSDGPDNAWYVARNKAVTFDDKSVCDTYVVAIAGSATVYDWFAEDFTVQSVVDFQAWVKKGVTTTPVVADANPSGTYIAMGTASAVYTILTQKSPKHAASPGISLYNFVSGLSPSSGSRIVFTGHSLGGALSPTVALSFVQSSAVAGFSPADVLTYPTAGPSPGNEEFTQLFQGVFKRTLGSGYKVWNSNIVNSLDIVPQAWSTNTTLSPSQNLENIPPIYGTPVLNSVGLAVWWFEFLANTSGITYIPIPATGFKGTTPRTPDDMSSFLAIAANQHLSEYYDYIGVHLPKGNLALGEGLIEKTKKEVYFSYPVIGQIAWGDEHKAQMEAATAKAVQNGAAPPNLANTR